MQPNAIIERFMILPSACRFAIDAFAERKGVKLGIGHFFIKIGRQEPEPIPRGRRRPNFQPC